MSSTHNKHDLRYTLSAAESYGLSAALGCVVMFSVCAVLFIIFRTLRDRRRRCNEHVAIETTNTVKSPEKAVRRKKRNRNAASGKRKEPEYKVPGFIECDTEESSQNASSCADTSTCYVYELDKPATGELAGEPLPEQNECVAEYMSSLGHILSNCNEDQSTASVVDDQRECGQGQCASEMESMTGNLNECQFVCQELPGEPIGQEQDDFHQEDSSEHTGNSTNDVMCLDRVEATPVVRCEVTKDYNTTACTENSHEDLGNAYQAVSSHDWPCSSLPSSTGANGNSGMDTVEVKTNTEENWCAKLESKVNISSALSTWNTGVSCSSSRLERLSACADQDRHQPEILHDRVQVANNLTVKGSEVTRETAGNANKLAENCDPAEISIMEATMDDNEWMSLGAEIKSGFTAQSLSEQAVGSGSERSVDDAKTSLFFDGHLESKSVATVHPLSHTVSVHFRVHYVTHSPFQLLAVTGNNKELGNWESFVPLWQTSGGFWSSTVALPADSHVEWKFVLVENGKISRWEECSNRYFYAGRDEAVSLHKWWGYI